MFKSCLNLGNIPPSPKLDTPLIWDWGPDVMWSTCDKHDPIRLYVICSPVESYANMGNVSGRIDESKKKNGQQEWQSLIRSCSSVITSWTDVSRWKLFTECSRGNISWYPWIDTRRVPPLLIVSNFGIVKFINTSTIIPSFVLIAAYLFLLSRADYIMSDCRLCLDTITTTSAAMVCNVFWM